MNRHISLVALAFAGASLAVTGTARADTDQTGWTRLARQSVDVTRDHDVVPIGREAGRFTQLRLAVEGDDLVLDSLIVTFANGDTFTPETPHYFREGTRSDAIELPGAARAIDSIELVYGDRRHSRARPVVEIWGFAAEEQQEWSTDGWDLLATKTVQNRRGTITLLAPKNGPSYDHLAVAVTEGKLKITSVSVRYNRGKRGVRQLDQSFDDQRRHQWFALDGKPRRIRSLTISYVNTSRRPATIEVYGRLGAPDEHATFDTTGWTMLSEQTVDGRHDYDVVQIGQDDGKFAKLAFVVVGGPVRIDGIIIHPRRGDDIAPDVTHLFDAGQRSAVIDLPGRRAVIEHVELRYGTERGDGHARVQIWAR